MNIPRYLGLIILLLVAVPCLILAAWLAEPAPATVKAQAQNTATLPAVTAQPTLAPAPTYDWTGVHASETQAVAVANIANSNERIANAVTTALAATPTAIYNISQAHNEEALHQQRLNQIAAEKAQIEQEQFNARLEMFGTIGGFLAAFILLVMVARILWHVGTKSAIEAARYNAPASPYNGPTSAETRTDDADYLSRLQPATEPRFIGRVSVDNFRHIATPEVLRKVAHLVINEQVALVYDNFTPAENGFSDNKFKMFQYRLVELGLAEWAETGSIQLTDEGRAEFTRWADGEI